MEKIRFILFCKGFTEKFEATLENKNAFKSDAAWK